MAVNWEISSNLGPTTSWTSVVKTHHVISTYFVGTSPEEGAKSIAGGVSTLSGISGIALVPAC